MMLQAAQSNSNGYVGMRRKNVVPNDASDAYMEV